MKKRELQHRGILAGIPGRRVMSLLLAASMLTGSVPAGAIPAYASEMLVVENSGGDELPLNVSNDPAPDTGQSLQLNQDTQGSQNAGVSLDVSNPNAEQNAPTAERDDGALLNDGSHLPVVGAESEGEGAETGETVASVTSSLGTVPYDNFSFAWEAAVSAASTEGSAVLTLSSDWVSDDSGILGTGYDFSQEGSILMDVPGGTITIEGNDHKIIRKGDAIPGGCVFGIFDGELVIKDAVITGGNSTSDGGAVLVIGGKVTLDNTEIRDNHAGTGAGLCVTGGSAVIKDSVITGNSADQRGGGIFVNTDAASLTLEGKVQVSGNTSGEGPDVYNGGSLSINMDELSAESHVVLTVDEPAETTQDTDAQEDKDTEEDTDTQENTENAEDTKDTDTEEKDQDLTEESENEIPEADPQAEPESEEDAQESGQDDVDAAEFLNVAKAVKGAAAFLSTGSGSEENDEEESLTSSSLALVGANGNGLDMNDFTVVSKIDGKIVDLSNQLLYSSFDINNARFVTNITAKSDNYRGSMINPHMDGLPKFHEGRGGIDGLFMMNSFWGYNGDEYPVTLESKCKIAASCQFVYFDKNSGIPGGSGITRSYENTDYGASQGFLYNDAFPMNKATNSLAFQDRILRPPFYSGDSAKPLYSDYAFQYTDMNFKFTPANASQYWGNLFVAPRLSYFGDDSVYIDRSNKTLAVPVSKNDVKNGTVNVEYQFDMANISRKNFRVALVPWGTSITSIKQLHALTEDEIEGTLVGTCTETVDFAEHMELQVYYLVTDQEVHPEDPLLNKAVYLDTWYVTFKLNDLQYDELEINVDAIHDGDQILDKYEVRSILATCSYLSSYENLYLKYSCDWWGDEPYYTFDDTSDLMFKLRKTYDAVISELKTKDGVALADPGALKVTINIIDGDETIKTLSSRREADQVRVEKLFDGSGLWIFFPMVDESDGQDITGTVQWNDNNNAAGKQPEDVTIKLLADGEVVRTAQVAGPGWTFRFPQMSVYKKGQEINYTLEMEPETNYLTTCEKKKVVDDGNDRIETQFVIKNTYVPDRTTLRGKIEWEDEKDQYKNRPSSVTLDVIGSDGKTVPGFSPVIVKGEPWEFELDIPGYNADTMRIVQSDLPDYYLADVTADNEVSIVNTFTAMRDFEVKVLWEDDKHQEARPDSVKVYLLDDVGHSYEETIDSEELSDGEWKAVFKNLPELVNGKTIRYSASEEDLKNYKVAIKTSIPGFVVTNTWNVEDTFDLVVKKAWNDDNNVDNLRPKEVWIQLYRNGEKLGNEVPLTGDEWRFTFAGLLKKDENRNPYNYTVLELDVDSWNPDNGDPPAEAEEKSDYTYLLTERGNTFTLTNTLTPHKKNRRFNIRWEDNDDQDGLRPNLDDTKKLLHLTANGKEVEQEGEITYGVETKEAFIIYPNLPTYDKNGKKIAYSISSDELYRYTVSVNGDEVVYTHVPEKVDIPVTVRWDDGNNQDGKRPESIKITLESNGSEAATAVLIPENKAETDWTYVFKGYPSKKDGNYIEYTAIVKDADRPELYDAQNRIIGLDGYPLINLRHAPQTVELTAEVHWNLGGSDLETVVKKPEKVGFHVMADGVLVNREYFDTLPLITSDTFTLTKKTYPKYEDGREITYTITQEPLDDFETESSVSGHTFTFTNTYRKASEMSVIVKWANYDAQKSVTVYLTENGLRKYGYPFASDEVKFLHLPVSDSYSVVVPDLPEGYYAVISDLITKGSNLNYTLYIGKGTPPRSMDVIIYWLDESGDILHDETQIPDRAVRVQALSDGEPVEVMYLSAVTDPQWYGKFEDLPSGKDGNTPMYSVVQETLENFRTTYSKRNNVYFIMNTKRAENDRKKSLSASIVWDDNNNVDGKRPDNVEVRLVQNDTATGKKIYLSDDQPSGMFNDLAVTDGEGMAYNYTAEVDTPDDYTVTKSTVGNLVTFTFSRKQDTTDVTVEVVFEDADNQDGKRPASALFTLQGDGKDVKTVRISDPAWKHTFTDVPKNSKNGKAIDYTVVPADLTGRGYAKDLSGTGEFAEVSERVDNKIVITYRRPVETTSVTFKKKWEDKKDAEKLRPTSVTVAVLCNGEMLCPDGSALTDNENEALIGNLSETDDWTAVIDGLPRYEPGSVGVAASYSIREIEPTEGYSASEYGPVLTNTHIVEEKEIKGQVIWSGETATAKKERKEEVRLRLLAGQESVGTLTVKAPENGGDVWPFSFGSFPVKKAGKEIAYSVVEDPVDNYVVTYGQKNESLTVTNTWKPGTRSVSVKIKWEDEEDFDGLQPDSVMVTIMRKEDVEADDEEWSLLGNPSKTNKWICTFDIPTIYKDLAVLEDTPAGYEATITGSADRGFTITNTHKVEKLDHPVNMMLVWEDDNNRDGIRPQSSTVMTLKHNNRTVGKQILNKDDTFAQFEDVPVVNEGDQLTIVPQKFSGYEAIVTGDAENGFTVTYIHEPETVDVTVKAVWMVPKDEADKLPGMFTIQIMEKNTSAICREVDLAQAPFDPEGDDTFVTWQQIVKLPKYIKGREGVRAEYTYAAVPKLDSKYKIDMNVSGFEIRATISTDSFLPVTIQWADGTDKDGVRPNEVKVALYYQKEGQEARKLAEKKISGTEEFYNHWDEWTGVFTYNSSYANDLKSFYVQEESAQTLSDFGYTVTGDSIDSPIAHYKEGEGFVLTNHRVPDQTKLRVYTAWDDNKNSANLRPENVEYVVYGENPQTGEKKIVLEFELNEAFRATEGDFEKNTYYQVAEEEIDQHWYFDVDLDLHVDAEKEGVRPDNTGVEVHYTIQQKKVKNYTSSSQSGNTGVSTIYVFKNKLTGKDLDVNITFQDQNNLDGIQPKELWVTLLSDGQYVDKKRANSANHFRVTFENMPVLDLEKKKIQYQVLIDIDGYYLDSGDVKFNDNNDPLDLVYKHDAPATATITGQVKWYDEGYKEWTRPEDVTLIMYANGKELRRIPVPGSVANTWQIPAGQGDPVFENGKEITYAIEQKAVKGYSTKVFVDKTHDANGNMSYKFEIRNSLILDQSKYDTVAYTITHPVEGQDLAETTKTAVYVSDSTGKNPTLTLQAHQITWNPTTNEQHPKVEANTQYLGIVKVESTNAWGFTEKVTGNITVVAPDGSKTTQTLTANVDDGGDVSFTSIFNVEGNLTVVNPTDQTYPNGIDRGMITLPEMVKLTRPDGTAYYATPVWDTTPLDDYDQETKTRQVFTITSKKLQLPAGTVTSQKLSASFKVIIEDADAVQPPIATPGSGTYSETQNVYLMTTQEDVQIQYQLWEDVEENPHPDNKVFTVYDGKPLKISKTTTLVAKCVKTEDDKKKESETVTFVYRFEEGKFKVTVQNGSGSGMYKPGDTVRILANDKKGLSGLKEKGQDLAKMFGMDDMSGLLDNIPDQDPAIGKFKGWKVVTPDGLELTTLGQDQAASFVMPATDVEIIAEFEGDTQTTIDESKKIKKVFITMSRTPAPGRNKMLSRAFVIETDHVSWAGTQGVKAALNAYAPGAAETMNSIKVMPVINKTGLIPMFNSLMDNSDWSMVFEFGRSYSAEFPLIACDGYVFDENVEVYVDGEKAKRGSGLMSVILDVGHAMAGWQGYTAQYTWTMRKANALSVESLDEIEVAAGTSLKDIANEVKKKYPTAKLMVEKTGKWYSFTQIDTGNVDCMVKWSTTAPSEGSYDPTKTIDQRFSFKGYLTYTKGGGALEGEGAFSGTWADGSKQKMIAVTQKYNPNGLEDSTKQIPIKVTVNVLAADKLSMPEASLKEGTYDGSQKLKLTQKEDAAIYYTLDGADPKSTSGLITRKAYGQNGETYISLPEDPNGPVEYTVAAYATKAGYKDSKIATFHYIINPTKGEKVTVKITKKWEDDNDKEDKRPDQVTFTLYADGSPTRTVVLSTANKVDENTWETTLSNLSKQMSGEDIQYTLAEKDVDGYRSRISVSTGDGGSRIFTVTNTKTAAGNVTIKGHVEWSDSGNADGNRPDKVVVRLSDSIGPVGEQTVTAANGWRFTFTDIESTASSFRLEQDGVTDYTTVVNAADKSSTGEDFVVVNTYSPATVGVTVSKVWDDENNADGKRPDSVTVKLMRRLGEPVSASQGKDSGADSEAKDTGITLTLSSSNNWQATFTGLKTHLQGRTVTWSVEEETVPAGYVASVASNGTNSYVITNRMRNAKISISGSKTWDDENNKDKLRPERITINLLADGTRVSSKNVTAADNWSWTFTDLDRYNEDGSEIKYTITENAVAEYTAIINGYDVTNKHTPEPDQPDKINISGQKTWDDANDRDGIRPERIIINLLADGEKAASEIVHESEGWAWTFRDLDKYDDNGKEITYTITENPVKGYTATIDGFNVTNRHEPETKPETVTVSGKKTWNDGDNKDGLRPERITINLLADGDKVGSRYVREADGWSWTFDDLEKFDENGKEIEYTITENPVAEYETSINGFNVTNTHTPTSKDPEKITISGHKIWDDDNNRDGIRPKSITINLLADGTQVRTSSVTEADGWSWSFADVDKADNNGREIRYTITEDPVTGYETTVDGYNVTNKHTSKYIPEPEKITVSGSKVWDDENDKDGIRPERITINLLADGSRISSEIVTAEEGWKWEFKDLDKTDSYGNEIKYTITENAVTGYTSSISGYNVTNRHEVKDPSRDDPTKVTVTGTNTWDDENDKDGIRPERITINLLADGEKAGSMVVRASDGWRWTFSDLDKTDARGNEIKYTITENKVEGYTTTVNGYDVTNRHEPEKKSPGSDPEDDPGKPEKTRITGTVIWDDQNDQDGIRPGSTVITLLADGEKKDSMTVSPGGSADTWKFEFDGLEKKNASGKDIVYTINASAIDGYSLSITGYQVTYIHTPEKKTVTGSKTWDDDNDSAGRRPKSITIRLLANGSTAATRTVTAQDGWKWEFKDVDVYDSGSEINYTISEDPVDGYQTEVKGYNVVNRYTPGKTNVYGNKTWNDEDNKDGIRPQRITINLLADGTKVDSRTVTAADDWSWNFADLPAEKNGKEIVYSITEDPVPDYETTINGFNVINYHAPETVPDEKITIAGKKTWDDENDKDGIRPHRITINLLANGTRIGSRYVTADDNWRWTFADLDKYDAQGKEIRYTITETPVEEYAAVVNGFDVTNRYTPQPEDTQKINITGRKTWDDENDKDGIRPDHITIFLLANGEKAGGKVVRESDDWAWTFADVDRLDANGKEIRYTIAEEEVDGYTSTVDGYNVTNRHVPGIDPDPSDPDRKKDIFDISGKKTWNDADDKDGIRPDSITINLLADGETVGSESVNAKEGWKWTFKGLDKYNQSGKEVRYTITENPVIGYEAAVSGYDVTNTHTPEQKDPDKINISGAKTWEDENDKDGIRPASIRVNLLANGVLRNSMQVTADEGWSWAFTDLDRFDADGKEIRYTVDEEPVAGYNAVMDGNDITNTHTPRRSDPSQEDDPEEPAKITISGTKTWNDGDDKDGLRPQRITVHLYANGEKIDSRYVRASDGWKYSFGELDKYDKDKKEISYTITENAVSEYETTINGFDITNTHTPASEDPEKITISGAKTWDDANDADGIRPKSIRINLLADGEEILEESISASDGWSWSFAELDRTGADGKEITYTITEDPVDGYETVVKGYNVTNRHIPKRITPSEGEKITVSGVKIWDDENDQDGIRPQRITINLLADGTRVSSNFVSAAEEWKWNFTNLEKYDPEGNEIHYSISENAVAGYETTVEGYDVINTHVPEKIPDEKNKTRVTGTVKWNDADNQDGMRPGSIEITLLADGKEVDRMTVTGSSSTWNYTFDDLDKQNASGKDVAYTVTASSVSGYRVTGSDADVTYTHAPEKTTVSGSKTWSDDNNSAGKRPDSITINLLADGRTKESRKVTESDGWKWSFTDLDKYASGKEIVYSVSEDPVDEYQSEVDGYDVTNSYTPGMTNVSGSKTWDDEDDRDDIRPSRITINLLENGNVIESRTVTAADSWSWNFADLPDEKFGRPVVYSITEEPVADYETTVNGYNIVNRHVPETMPDEKITIAGKKTWNDEDDKDGLRPQRITVNLLADGVRVGSRYVTESDNWRWTFADLDKYNAQGQEILYTITENPVEEYAGGVKGYNVTNSHTPEPEDPSRINIFGRKTWDDEDDKDGIRPSRIIISLLANGTKVDRRVVRASDGWAWTFADQPKFDAKGNEIAYTIDEEPVEGYKTSVSGYDVTNTHITGDDPEVHETIDITGRKTWNDDNDADGIRPEKIVINLFADGETVSSEVVDASEGWSWTFKGLDQYNQSGEEIHYTITEDPVPGYSTAVNGYDVINTHTSTNPDPERINISGAKTWDDENDADGIRPEGICVNLLVDGHIVSTMMVTEKDGWCWSFTDLDRYDDAGQPINYVLAEDPVDGYETSVDGYNVTNRHVPENITPPVTETVTVSGRKTWDDEHNLDGIRPDSITINLLADGVRISSNLVTEAEDWKWTFDGLDRYDADGREISYTISENPVEGYESTVNGWNVVNKHVPEKLEPDLPGKISVSGLVIWDDEDDLDKIRPDHVKIRLLADGEVVDSDVIRASDDWTFRFGNLDKYDAYDDEIEYTITEVTVDGYETTIDGFYVVNRHVPESTEPQDPDKTRVSGRKIWNDADDLDEIRPERITINLLADGETVDSEFISEADGWKWSFDDLDRFGADGHEIEYTITEMPVNDYNTVVIGYNVVNEHYPEKATVRIAGRKTWDDADNKDGIRPASITVNVLANGVKTDSRTVTAADDWSWTFEDLEKYDASGQEIRYTISEDPVKGYLSIADGYNLTNRHVPDPADPARRNILVTKTWDDENDLDGVRPKRITVNLLVNGERIASKIVRASDGWGWTFENLDRYAEDGSEIRYTVSEIPINEYQTSIDGFDITNKHVPEKVVPPGPEDPDNPDEPDEPDAPGKTRVSGRKIWNDGNDEDGLRPDSIVINLLANGTRIQSKVIRESDGWKWTFRDLDQLDQNGSEIVYSITENTVEGYETTVNGFDVINTYTPEHDDASKINVTGHKTWDDKNDKDGIRPASIIVNLVADGEIVGSEIVTAADDGWTYSFMDLDKYDEDGKRILYTIDEDAVNGYEKSVESDNLTNRHVPEDDEITPTPTPTLTPTPTPGPDGPTPGPDGPTPGPEDPDKTTVSGYVYWDDEDNKDGIRPESIVVFLLADGQVVDQKTVRTDGTDRNAYSFTGLNRYAPSVQPVSQNADAAEDAPAPVGADDDRREIAYAVRAGEAAGYTSSISGYNITYKHTPSTIEPDDPGQSGYMQIYGEIIWEDSDNKDGTRPDSVVVRLYQGESVVQQVTVTPDLSGRWMYEFSKVPLYSGTGTSRQKLQYALKQAPADGYTWSAVIVGQENSGDTIKVETRITDVLKEGFEAPESPTPVPEGSGSNNSNSNITNVHTGGSTASYGSASDTSVGSRSAAVDHSGRSTVSNSSGDAKTGDDTNLLYLFGLLSAAAVVMLLCMYTYRRRRKQ